MLSDDSSLLAHMDRALRAQASRTVHTTARALWLGVTACALAYTAPSQSQGAYARVLDATPVYEQVAVPQQSCTELQQQTRCTNSTTYEERLVGYDVLYEYDGQQRVQRMAQDPGVQVPVDAGTSTGSYSSRPGNPGNAVTPGRKSYGSVPAGAPVVDSIEYRGNEQVPVHVEVRPGHGHQQPQRPLPVLTSPRHP